MPDIPAKPEEKQSAHPTNPVAVDKWSEMSDAKDFYVVQHDSVGAAQTGRIYHVGNHHGSAVERLPVATGDALSKGAIVSAKTFGPGADLQRLIDLGAIRPATKWEADSVHAELTGEADKARKDQADKAAKAKADEAKVGPEAVKPAAPVEHKPVEPVKAVEPAKVEAPKVVEAEKK